MEGRLAAFGNGSSVTLCEERGSLTPHSHTGDASETDHPPLALTHPPDTGQVSVRRVKLLPDTGKRVQMKRTRGGTLSAATGSPCVHLPATRCSGPPASVLVSLRRCFLSPDAVSIPHGLGLHLPAGGATLRSGQRLRAGRSVACLRSAAHVTRWSGAEGLGETRVPVLAARRRIGDGSDCLDRLTHRVATLLPVPLLPFHSRARRPCSAAHPPLRASACTCKAAPAPDTPGVGEEGGGARGHQGLQRDFMRLIHAAESI
ncbi:unnamed protein product [Pleuronectes platessa]|uniref:Uncharacterized protein n=1 Tax=Pleuronectes platessa TaxID=8262 RepID=A0A9N7YIM7_PLEPL|nr:unnamed protein product [Pleuronectes platessa]